MLILQMEKVKSRIFLEFHISFVRRANVGLLAIVLTSQVITLYVPDPIQPTHLLLVLLLYHPLLIQTPPVYHVILNFVVSTSPVDYDFQA
jgi:hypothetical protein